MKVVTRCEKVDKYQLSSSRIIVAALFKCSLCVHSSDPAHCCCSCAHNLPGQCNLKDSQGFSRIKCRGDSPCHRHLLQFLPTAAESLFLACRIRCNGQNVHFNKLSLQMLRIRSNTNNQGPENDFVIMSYHISIWGKTSDQMNFEMSNFFTVKILIRDAFKIYSNGII